MARTKHPTPLNELGLVDAKALVKLVAAEATFDFAWDPSLEIDCHHLQWPRCNYPNIPDALVNPAAFRELSVNKIMVQKKFHPKIHDITEPPPLPEEEVMHEQYQAQRVINKLYNNAWLAMRLERVQWISDERLQRGREYQLERANSLVDQAAAIPREFQLLNFKDLRPTTIEEVRASAQQLGQYAVRASNFVRFIRSTAA